MPIGKFIRPSIIGQLWGLLLNPADMMCAVWYCTFVEESRLSGMIYQHNGDIGHDLDRASNPEPTTSMWGF